jgi:hypothetical protein
MQTLPTESKRDLSGYKHRFTVIDYSPRKTKTYSHLGIADVKPFSFKNSIHSHNEAEPTVESCGQNEFIKGCRSEWARSGLGVP